MSDLLGGVYVFPRRRSGLAVRVVLAFLWMALGRLGEWLFWVGIGLVMLVGVLGAVVFVMKFVGNF
ncbi:MAG: hypothetical protein AAGJ81_10615 [Verrucomicrobiota bacterium]